MKKVILIAAIIVVSFLSIAWSPCQADQTSWVCPNDDEANGIYWICNYFPIKPNSQWQYTTGEYHIVNDVRTCSSGYPGILYKTSTYEYSSYIQNGEDGLLLAGCQYDGGVFEDSGGHFLLIPPQIHLAETIRTYIDEKGAVDVTLVGIETITVPAGTFNTLRIEWVRSRTDNGCAYKTTAWLAKGIGPVKIHRTDANPADCLGCMLVCDPNDDVVRLNTPAELISFDINQEKPKISISPMSVNLGSIRVGSTSNPRTVTIKNTGKGDLIINPITISGINQSEFIESDDCSMVPAKSSCHITVTFTPLPPFVKKTAFMSISSNDPKKPTINVKLLGQAPPPKISVSPKSVNFGTVSDGSTSAPKTVTIKNTGISDLTVNAITFTGTNAVEFSQTSNCTVVAKGSSCAITVTFGPTSPGSETAMMSISSNDPKKPVVNVKLLGKGQSSAPPPIDVSGSWKFDSQVVSTNCDSFYVGQTKTANMTINMNGSNVELSSPNVQFGRSETRGQAITGHISGNVLTMAWNEPPKPTDSECPTCTWTVAINGVISSDLRTIEATLQKIGSGGECSTTMTFIGTKL